MSSGRKAYCFSVVAIIDGADDERTSGEAGERLAQVRDKRVDDTRRLAAGVACRGARRAVGNPETRRGGARKCEGHVPGQAELLMVKRLPMSAPVSRLVLRHVEAALDQVSGRDHASPHASGPGACVPQREDDGEESGELPGCPARRDAGRRGALHGRASSPRRQDLLLLVALGLDILVARQVSPEAAGEVPLARLAGVVARRAAVWPRAGFAGPAGLVASAARHRSVGRRRR